MSCLLYTSSLPEKSFSVESPKLFVRERTSAWTDFAEIDVYKRQGYAHAVSAAELILSGEMAAAMNEYNRKKKDE